MTHLSTATNNHPNHRVHANRTIIKGIAASLLAMATLLPFTSVSAATYSVNPSPANSSMTHTLNYGLLNFAASASKKVSNDQINATLSKTVQNKSSSEVANQIATTLNQAVAIAKKYPQVQVSTGNQATYPQYDKNQKIIGWTGNASLNLKSTDTVAASKLIAELQSFMTVDGLDFSVSDAARKATEQELMMEASKNFQRQAQTLMPVWGAKGYQLVSLEFSQGGDYRAPRAYGSVMMLEAASAKVADQNFQAGDSTITVTANGTVQLVK